MREDGCHTLIGFPAHMYAALLQSHPGFAMEARYDLYESAWRGDLHRVCRVLWECDVEVEGPAAMATAAERGHVEVVRFLLSQPGIDPTAHENGALRHASDSGHIEVVRALLADPRVDPSWQDNEALRLAAAGRHVDVVKLLLCSSPRVRRLQASLSSGRTSP